MVCNTSCVHFMVINTRVQRVMFQGTASLQLPCKKEIAATTFCACHPRLHGWKERPVSSACPFLYPSPTPNGRHPGICFTLLPEVGTAGLSGNSYSSFGHFCYQGLTTSNSVVVWQSRSGLILLFHCLCTFFFLQGWELPAKC